MTTRALRHHQTLVIPVPPEQRAIVGADTLTVEAYRDASGGSWRYQRASQPFCCSWCRRWRVGGYWSSPPLVVCTAHFAVAPHHGRPGLRGRWRSAAVPAVLFCQ